MTKPLIVVVGAGPGVGTGVAKKFGSSGFRVVLMARTEEKLKNQANQLKGLGIEVDTIVADVSKKTSLTAAFEQIKEKHGEIDVLVYNAAAWRISNPSVVTEQQLMDDLNVNVTGALTSAQFVIPDMIKRKTGTILLTGAIAAMQPKAFSTTLSVGKAAMRALAFSLADELTEHGIFVGTITIMGRIQPGTFFDPDAIAETFWELYENRDTTEILFGDQRMNMDEIESIVK